MSRASPPPGFDEEFISWFREETEAAWDEYRPRTFDQYVAGRVGGHDWQAGTRWTCDLADRDIDEIERRWGLAFPADYRLFLRSLHATDRPRTGALYQGGYELVPAVGPGVYHWLHDESAMRAALEDVVQALVFDVENNVLWPDAGGCHRRSVVEAELVGEAGQLVQSSLASLVIAALEREHIGEAEAPVRANEPEGECAGLQHRDEMRAGDVQQRCRLVRGQLRVVGQHADRVALTDRLQDIAEGRDGVGWQGDLDHLSRAVGYTKHSMRRAGHLCQRFAGLPGGSHGVAVRGGVDGHGRRIVVFRRKCNM